MTSKSPRADAGAQSPVLTRNLCALADEYARASGMMLSTIGLNFHGNPRFFGEEKGIRARNGISFTIRKYDRLLLKFSHLWPEGAIWPPDIPRPDTAGFSSAELRKLGIVKQGKGNGLGRRKAGRAKAALRD